MLKERYRIVKQIGKGGFSETFLAEDTKLERYCVVKKLTLKLANTWKAFDLFEREAKILLHLKHSSIPAFYDYFNVDDSEDSGSYLVEEYINGRTLKELVDSGKHFTEKEVISIGMNVLRTLEYLHSFSPRIIHRDIKPENILITENNQVFLIDFGGVKDVIADPDDHSSTIIGSFGYMPPEQVDGFSGTYSDIYSLGVTLVFLLSHRDPMKIEKKNFCLDFKPYVNISKDFCKVLEKMLQADKDKRYYNAADLLVVFSNIQTDRKSTVSTFILAGILIFLVFFASIAYFFMIFPIQEISKPLKVFQKQTESQASQKSIKEDITEGLIAHWSFEEASGSGGGELYGTAFVKGKIGRGLYLDGIDDHVVVPDGSWFDILSNGIISVTAWVNFESLDKPGVIINKQDHNADEREYSLQTDGRSLYFSICSETGDKSGWSIVGFPLKGNIEAGKWYYVAAVNDGADVSIYLNGNLMMKASGKSRMINGRAPVGIGAYIGEGKNCVGPFNGILDEITIYSKALTLENLLEQYQKGLEEKKYGIIPMLRKQINMPPFYFANQKQRNVDNRSVPTAVLNPK